MTRLWNPDGLSWYKVSLFSIRNKRNSSIVKAGNALIQDKIDCFISAGNTGALVALAQFYLKPIDGVDRPVVAAIVPTKIGMLLLIDSGCNVDSKPEWLYQYALLANEYYKLMFNSETPKIGLLSVGEEPNKGNALTLETYKLLENNKKFNETLLQTLKEMNLESATKLTKEQFKAVFMKLFKLGKTENQVEEFLEVAKTELENMNYQVYFTGAKYTYNGVRQEVQSNDYLVALKVKEDIKEIDEDEVI